MLKNILIALALLIVLYFATAGTLTISGACPKYINVMPQPVSDGVPNIKGPNDSRVWHIFCPFAEKVY